VGTTVFAGPVRATTSPEEAARFLSQASLGADWDEIQRTAAIGVEGWLDEQFQRPIGYHQPYLDERVRQGLEVNRDHRRWIWWEQVMTGPDPLRQRIALALSELLVVSDNLSSVGDNPQGLANYYDMLLENAFGNYRDLLYDVTRHPIMGVYLSHLKNEKSTTAGRFPDENYAREIMQLFSIGLFLLNPDGSHVLDGTGQPIPTYDNGDITEFARIFTGFSFDSPGPSFREGRPVWTSPMRMFQRFHDTGEKHLLRGKYVPAGQPGLQDIDDAIDNLFEHPNVGPFVGRRLIQRLVTSNPSPAYLTRVSSAFNDNGSGVRGDMQAVIRAVLLDPEARELPDIGEIHQGRLKESFLRRISLARAFNASNLMLSFPISDPGAHISFAQRPLSSPTVFNFFLPDYQPQGEIADADLVAPEFQILTTLTAISSANALRSQVDGTMNSDPSFSMQVRLNLTDEIGIAMDAHSLVERLDLLLMHGRMSPPMQAVLIQAIQQLPDPVDRVKMAVHLISISPEYCVLR
jgi:uncharacterized protein (DUF1800 family)